MLSAAQTSGLPPQLLPAPNNSSSQCYLHSSSRSSLHISVLHGQKVPQLEVQHSREPGRLPWQGNLAIPPQWQDVEWSDSAADNLADIWGLVDTSHPSAATEEGLSELMPCAWQPQACELLHLEESHGGKTCFIETSSQGTLVEHLQSADAVAAQAWPNRQQQDQQGLGWPHLQQQQHCQQAAAGGPAGNADGCAASCSPCSPWHGEIAAVHVLGGEQLTAALPDPCLHLRGAAAPSSSAVWLSVHPEGSAAGLMMADSVAGRQDQCSNHGVHGTHSSSSSAAGEVLNIPRILDDSCSAMAAIGSHFTAADFQECHVTANSPVCSNNLRLEALGVAPLDGPAAQQIQQLQDASPASAWELTGTECMAPITMAPCIVAGEPSWGRPGAADFAAWVSGTAASGRSAGITPPATAAGDRFYRGAACSGNTAVQPCWPKKRLKRSASTAELPSDQSVAAAAAAAAAATTGISPLSSSLGSSGVPDKALLHVLPASPRKQKKHQEAPVAKGATSQHRSRLQKKTDELHAVKAEMAELQSAQEGYRKKFEILRAENADLLTRLTNVTTKWRQSVTENAGLTQALGGLQQQLANLQHSLATCQQELAELRSQQLFNRN